jgi:hypothetical protein
MDTETQTDPKDQIAFEKVRLDYCMDLFNREEQRKEQLERKSQFYLSFITLFLGAIFLKADSLLLLSELIDGQTISPPLMTLLHGSIIALGILILFSVMAILGVTRLWSYKGPYPEEIVYSLFSPDSDFTKKYTQDEEDNQAEKNTQALWIRAIALNFAVALDFNKSINDRKSRWIMISSYGIFLAVAAFAILLSVIVYITIYI